MRQDVLSNNGKLLTSTYESMDELIEAGKERAGHRTRSQEGYSVSWTGVSSFAEAQTLGREGWHDETAQTLTVAEHAVELVQKTYDMRTFVPTWEVYGSDVDVARYVSGEPECMIDYPLKPSVKAGKVITLCASVSRSSAISVDTITKRGRVVVALAIALSQIGYAIEIWADQTTRNVRETHTMQQRFLVKAPGEPLDVGRIMFGLAHPAMSRVLGFAVRDGITYEYARHFGNHHMPTDPIHDLPDGTLYLDRLLSNRDIPDADKQLVTWLQELEILPLQGD